MHSGIKCVVSQPPFLFLMADPTSPQNQKLFNLRLNAVIMLTWILIFNAKILCQPITGTSMHKEYYTVDTH